jgi:hypothetical protein
LKTVKELHELIDSIFTADKTSGDLGKLLSQLKDETNEVFSEISKRDLAVDSHIKELDDLKERNSRLVEHNGALLMKIPVTPDPIKNKIEEDNPDHIIDWKEVE